MIDNFKNKYFFLSNFYLSPVKFEGLVYPSVEHAFQAAKTLDKEERKEFAILKTPSDAKKKGRYCQLRSDWEEVKVQVMLECLRNKFKDKTLRKMLLETGDEILVEGNTWHDNCWGSCSCEKCKDIEGKNFLGKCLMRVREEIIMKNKILIVVDMQNDFIDGVLGTKEAVSIVPNVKKKIEEYKEKGHDIIFTRDTHYDNYLETNEGKHLPYEHCILNTQGWKVRDELYDEKYLHINKESFGYNAWDTCIDAGVEDIELVGLCTDICVVSNALILKATFPEANITVDASCCAGVTPEKHMAALETMKSCQINVIGE